MARYYVQMHFKGGEDNPVIKQLRQWHGNVPLATLAKKYLVRGVLAEQVNRAADRGEIQWSDNDVA